MLKIQAIKSTWETLSADDQLSLLTDLKLMTLGLCKETSGNIFHESKHILEIFGPLPYQEYKRILPKYKELMEKVISGTATVRFGKEKAVSINLSTNGDGFQLRYTNWGGVEILDKNQFLIFCYGENVSSIYLDDILLSKLI